MRLLSFEKILKSAAFFFLITVTVSCQKDFYDENYGKLPSSDSYFGFELRGDIDLSVNYDAPGFRALIEVYDQNPLEESTNLKKEGIEPVYKAFTDSNGKLTAKMYIPTTVKEAYLYTERIGLPKCVKLQTEGNGFAYDATKVMATRAQGLVSDAQLPFPAASPSGGSRTDNVYSIVAWDINGKPEAKYMTLMYSMNNESMGDITSRVGDFLTKHNVSTTVVGNKDLIRDPEKLNISIPQNVDKTKINVTFVSDNGAFNNSLGYYYYPSGSPVTVANFYKQKKYVIFPNASNSYSYELKSGHTVNLLYFDEKGNASEEFPGGYTIGWFLISDGYYFNSQAFVRNIQEEPYTMPALYPSLRNTCFSNEIKTANADPRNFISAYDEASKLLVFGIEDNMKNAADDYMDVLFFASTTPDVGAGDRPSITDPTIPEIKEETETIYGTLAFEDQWPKGGDYDMNDVIIEYKRIITFNQDNYVTEVVESFKPVQKPNSATMNNLFAYRINNMGTIELPADCEIESATNSIILAKSVKLLQDQVITIKRTFEASARLAKDDIKKDFNPYILVNGNRQPGRQEVHLPKQLATTLADKSQSQTEDDAFYIKKDGKYPFAINIPVINFTAVQEGNPIDSESQYPLFRTWAESKGTLATDWYNHYNGGK